MELPETNGNLPDGQLPGLSANPGRGLYSAAAWRGLGRKLQLSPRELEIAQEIFDDQSEAVIAADLGISIHTVHTYSKRLYQKLGARSRVELVCIVVAAERDMR